jgi:ribonuclease T2
MAADRLDRVPAGPHRPPMPNTRRRELLSTKWLGPIAIFALIALAVSVRLAAAQSPGEPGKFDFYVLALSWSPSYCEAERGRADPVQCDSGRPYAFVVHGLWPQYERGYPRACVDPAPRISERLISSMLETMPARGLVIHQWRAHGTCSGLAPDDYFALVRRARLLVTIPDRFHRLDRYTMVSPAEVADAFRAANEGLGSGAFSVTCDGRRLREVRICLTRDLGFRDCPEVARQACRAPRVVMPPVRGG